LAALLAALLLPIIAFAAPGSISPAGAQAGGSIVIMGIDAEDGGPGGHGPIANYENIVTAVNDNVSNGQTGIAVMGGQPGSSVTAFWDQISVDLGIPVTYFVGAAAIAGADFSQFAIIVASSSEFETGGGLTNEENDALTLRAFDVVDSVNAGGGLIGFNAAGLTEPYGYMGDFGTFTSVAGDYSVIAPTPEGEAIGVDLSLSDFCCWHDTYTEYPSFLGVLATNAEQGSPTEGNVAALGGFDIAIPTGCVLVPETAQLETGGTHTVTATATEEGAPAVGIPVVFEVLTGPNAGKTGNNTTDASGNASFTYTGDADGADEIAAAFTDSLGRVRNCNIVTANWATPPPAPAPVAPVARPVALTPAFTG
jgi:hypothetical protein